LIADRVRACGRAGSQRAGRDDDEVLLEDHEAVEGGLVGMPMEAHAEARVAEKP
jgi:hypothetical protein